MAENILDTSPPNLRSPFQEVSLSREKPIKEPWQREVEDIYQAMLLIQRKASGVEEGGLDRWDLLNLHKIIMNDPINPEKTGVLREVPVIVRGRVDGKVVDAAFSPPGTHFLSEYFNEFANKFEERTARLSSESEVSEVLDLAAWAHCRFIQIHPFTDGNGRIARLLVDFIFRKARLLYIRKWNRDEYDQVVYDIYKDNNLNHLRIFLANRLLPRLEEAQGRIGPTANSTLRNYIDKRRKDTEAYIMKVNREDLIPAIDFYIK